jgi:hypothetical protein
VLFKDALGFLCIGMIQRNKRDIRYGSSIVMIAALWK